MTGRRDAPIRRASVNANTMKTKILVIDPPRKSDAKMRLLTVHLCPDAEDLSYGFDDGKRPPLYWNRIHINTPWFHLMSAITPSGRFVKSKRLPDGTFSRSEYTLEWAVFSRWRRSE